MDRGKEVRGKGDEKGKRRRERNSKNEKRRR